MKLIKSLSIAALLIASTNINASNSKPTPIVKFPFSAPLSNTISMIFENPKELGVCIAIKAEQAKRTEEYKKAGTDNKELVSNYNKYYKPVIKQLLDKHDKIKNICSTDPACYEKYFTVDDATILQGYNRSKLYFSNIVASVSDFETQSLIYCGKAKMN